MSGIVWLTSVSQVAVWPAWSMAACVSGSSISACWSWPNCVQSSAGGEEADGVGRRPPDHGREDGHVLGAMFTSEVTPLLELLLQIIPLDARVWVKEYQFIDEFRLRVIDDGVKHGRALA